MSDRGMMRERGLEKGRYFAGGYFELRQLSSYAHQLSYIHAMEPESILEVGIGNGFVSTYLKRAGYDVETADINPALEPDYCAPLSDLESLLPGRIYDVVVCCEVLEHLPFVEFVPSVKTLARIARRLFLTLPDCRKMFGFGGRAQLPKRPATYLAAYLRTPLRRPLPAEHFWEVGSTRETSEKAVRGVLEGHYDSLRGGVFAMNPAHRYYICSGSRHAMRASGRTLS